MNFSSYDLWLINQAEAYYSSEYEDEYEEKYNPFDDDYFYDVEHGN